MNAAVPLEARFSPPRSVRRVLFAGLGGIGQRHLRNVRALLGERVSIDAYRVRREQTVLDDQLQMLEGEALERRYELAVFSELDAALERRPDVVFVTNPSSLHVALALRAAEAGAHLFIEKPLSHTLTGIDQLRATVKRRGLVAFVAYQLRRHPGFVRLAQVLSQGLIGEPLCVRAEVGEYLPAFHPFEDYRRMYAARRDLGGGVTLSQIHELDYLCALFGMPRRVFAMGGKVSSLEIDVDDLTSALLEFRGSQDRPLVAELHQDFFQRPSSRSCLVIGERGRLEWSLSQRHFRRWDANGELVEHEDYAALPRNQLFLDELSYFFDCIEQERAVDSDLAAGEQSLRLALALLKSQATGLPVHFAEET